MIATDSSESQLAAAFSKPNIEYRHSSVEDSGLEDNTADVVTVAQAYHWFDHAAFLPEVKRVIKSGGLFAVWTYGNPSTNQEVDEVVFHLYKEITGRYWPKRRKHVEQGYAELPFPFQQIETPEFAMTCKWNLEQLFSYIGTWSGVNYYKKEHGQDPREFIVDDLQKAWGDPEQLKTVSFPLTVLAGKSSV